MKNSRISILGCGWLGKPLAEALVRKEFTVSGSTTTSSKMEELSAIGVKPFLISFSPGMEQLTSEFFKADVLIITIPPRKKTGDPEFYFQQIQSIIKEAASNVKKIIFISSTSVYQDLDKVISESDDTVSEEENVLVKAENLLLNQAAFSTTVIRFGGLVGHERHPGRFLANKTNIKGADMPINLIHLTDCIAIISKVIEMDIFGEVFNACADLHPTKKEFYKKAAESLGLTPPVFLQGGHESFKIISSEKIKMKLNFAFKYYDPFLMI